MGRWAGWRSVAAECVLDREKDVQQFAWREMRFKSYHRVREAGLIFESDGRGVVERGARSDAAKSAQAFDGCGERGFRRAGGTEKVCAKGDVGERHAYKRLA